MKLKVTKDRVELPDGTVCIRGSYDELWHHYKDGIAVVYDRLTHEQVAMRIWLALQQVGHHKVVRWLKGGTLTPDGRTTFAADLQQAQPKGMSPVRVPEGGAQ